MRVLRIIALLLATAGIAHGQTAALEAPAQAGIGTSIQVSWTGPGQNYDSIYLVKSGAPDAANGIHSIGILSRKNPVTLVMAEEAGDYELRYWSRTEKQVIARRPLTIVDVPASLEAPASAKVGANLEVKWEGPGNDYDWIGLFEPGAADKAKAAASTAILSQRNPIVLRLPETAGDYELRYKTRQTKRTLAARPLTVTDVAASLEAPERATAATTIPVGWEGPGRDYDQIALYPPGAADDAKPLRVAAILSGQNPVNLRLPDVEGAHQLRYRTAQTGKVLARRPITIDPAGRLQVTFERAGEIKGSAGSGSGAVEVILDASGSMLQRENGTRRIEIARSVLTELVREQLSDEHRFALRVFGHKEADKCRTDLEIPLGKLDRRNAAARIASINAKNLAKTPIADSLAKITADLAEAKGPKTVILITDGEETCDGNPAAAIQKLRAQGLDIQVSIVGFAIEDAALKSDFQSWAELGGGGYFDARSAAELSKSLRTVISGPFRVLDQEGNVVGQGIIGGAEIVLPAGTYRVETVGSSPLVKEDVQIKPQQLTQAFF